VGLLPQAIDELNRLGYTVEVCDLRTPRATFTPDPKRLWDLSSDDRSMIQSVAREYLGRIEVAGPRDAFEKTVALCRAFPKARFLVAIATNRDAHTCVA
jgi:hypothetical protein